MYFQNDSFKKLEIVLMHNIWLLTDLRDFQVNYTSSEIRCIRVDTHETCIYSSMMLLSLGQAT
jgi:hypothetical protein